MVRLVSHFKTDLRNSSPYFSYIAEMMEGCSTGTDRLPRPLKKGDIIGHKTGTGDRNADGLLIGINDVGYIMLADGREYCVAVFVSDSAYSYPETERIIGDISEIIYNFINE